MILTTDRETTDAVRERLEGAESLPSREVDTAALFQGHLTGLRDGSRYSILIAQIPQRDAETMGRMMRRAIELRRPRYLLVLGTALAVANDSPLGAVGIITMSCEFDLALFEASRDMGKCFRPDGGLRASALALKDQWIASAGNDPSRNGCSPARVMKLAALSGEADPGPRYVEVVTTISNNIHRGVIFERNGTIAAEAAEALRHERRVPIGFLMVRGVSGVRGPGMSGEEDREAGNAKLGRIQKACAARDTADFATELIRHRWPVASSN